MASREKRVFEKAFVMTLQSFWPRTTREQALTWMREYLGVPVGARGYDWSPSAADDIAREIASEFGEESDGKS